MDNNRTLDLTDMSPKQTKRLNEIAEEIKVSYTEFVDHYCRKHDHYLFWATPFSSRNTYNDDTFLHLCRVLLAEEIVESRSDIDLVIVETKCELLTLNMIFGGKVHVKCLRNVQYKGPIRNWIDRWCGFASYVRRHFAYIRYADRKEFSYPDNVSIVIGPAISTDFEGYSFNDRYTTGIFDYRDGLYLPYFVNTQHVPNKIIFDRIRNCSNYRFIYDRSLVRVSDIFEIIKYWRYVTSVKKESYEYKGMDVSPIVRQNLEFGKCNSTTYDGLFMIKLLCRLANKGVNVCSFIQWYEGRPFDILTASAIRRFFPQSNSIGYEGRPLKESILGESISEYQYLSGFSPRKMAIPSRKYENRAHLFCKDVPLIFVPILRNEYTLRSANSGQK